MLILTAAVAWSTYQLRDIEGKNVMGKAYRQFQNNSHHAIRILEQKGLRELRLWLAEGKHNKAMQLYVFSFDRQQRLGPTLPTHLQRYRSPGNSWNGNAYPDQHRPHWLISRIVRPPAAMPYQLIATFKRPHPLQLLFTPLRILIALLVSGVVCFWMARHITRPITRLRIATQKLSTGDLNVRVGQELGQRNDELGKLAKDFDRMAEQLQTLLTSQQQLLRDVSHELRSPLARLQVALELARQRSTGEIDTELNRIESETERLNELIGQVLTLARMDTGERMLDKQDTDILQLLQNIIADAQFEAQKQNRRIIITTTDTCKLTIDAPLLHSAIENIVRNAIKYTNDHTPVELSLTLFASYLSITVRDHGPGVPTQQLSDLFKPFARLSAARNRDSGGYGLGLAIAERAIHLHGGKIEAENCNNGGLLIRITLPLETSI